MKRYYLALIALLPLGCIAAEVESASLDVSVDYGFAQETGMTMHGLLELVPSLDLKFSDAASFSASARLRADAKDNLEPGRPDLDFYAPGSRPLQLGDTGTAELRDFFFEYRTTNGLARFGKQQIAWGRLRAIKTCWSKPRISTTSASI